MKVMWFEVTEPSIFISGGSPVGGWQDSLERIIRKEPNIELTVAFISHHNSETKVVDGVTYEPIYFSPYTFKERHFQKYWDVYVKKMLPTALEIIRKHKPDIIQIFGTEWPFGQIVNYIYIPVVIHIQGAIIPYNNALYPPGYSLFDELIQCGLSPRKWFKLWEKKRDIRNRAEWENRTWKKVSNYMGRTNWDKNLSAIMHPNCYYYHVEEALCPSFLSDKIHWKNLNSNKIRLVSTGCSTFWKGPDMLLKVAKLLTELDVDFEWNVAGKMQKNIQNIVERKEGARFTDCHVKILGFIGHDQLKELLLASTLYVHTAYVENSPNSICEAQCVGLPVVSTNVGGISSLVEDGIDGILVPANDPWQMASAIISLSGAMSVLSEFSKASRAKALLRHNDENIKNQLLSCYSNVLQTSLCRNDIES